MRYSSGELDILSFANSQDKPTVKVVLRSEETPKYMVSSPEARQRLPGNPVRHLLNGPASWKVSLLSCSCARGGDCTPALHDVQMLNAASTRRVEPSQIVHPLSTPRVTDLLYCMNGQRQYKEQLARVVHEQNLLYTALLLPRAWCKSEVNLACDSFNGRVLNSRKPASL